MSKSSRIAMFFLRISLGWLFFYAGITKVINPEWSAAGYLKGAKTFSGFYNWLASDSMIGLTNFLNEWGLTLIGLSLMVGALVRLSAPLGALIMALYWIPILDGFMPDTHSFIVDQHIVYVFAFLLLGSLRAGRFWGLDAKLHHISALRKLG